MSSVEACKKNNTQQISSVIFQQQKNNEVKQKYITKNSVRQAGKYIFKPKMQKRNQINQQFIVQYGCVHTIQNTNMKQTKKL